MPRMLVGGVWYDPVSSRSLYEADYEAAILDNATELFPGFRCVRFKKRVDSEYGAGKPDLALIDLQYRSWFVVEVELDIHPLHAHVEEQVRKFASGRYTAEHADALHHEAPDLDPYKLQEMLLGDQPEVLVLVTSQKPDWSHLLARFGAGVGIIEMFRGERDEVILRVNGDQPSAMADEVLSLCTVDRFLPNSLRLQNPATFAGADYVSLLLDGQRTDWRLHRFSDTAYMIPTGRSPLGDVKSTRFEIVRKSGGEKEIRGI